MHYSKLNLRRFFRNRFEYYVETDGAECAGLYDGVRLTLPDLCDLLFDDSEPFPRRYDPDMRKLCGHEYMAWFRSERTFGQACRVLRHIFKCREAGEPRPSGLWVAALLRQPAMQRSETDMAGSLAKRSVLVEPDRD